ncbi:MAG: hypothetical protein IPP19_09495 [Verrucomicrobia bacterium]|nr:hypothetical protein [Verrucomicrobiota bacterium]
MIYEGLFEDGFAGAGFTEDEAKPALLGVDFQDVEDLLLVREQRKRFRVEGDFLKTEVGADHGCASAEWFGFLLSGFWLPASGIWRLVSGLRSLAIMSSSRASPMRSPL